MYFLKCLPKSLEKRIIQLRKKLSPYTKRVYLVGGSVRDIYLGKKPKDLDIEIYDILPNDFEKLAKKWNLNGVGKSFFVYKYKDIDLSLPRIENKINQTHQGFEVSFCNDEKNASLRRDFTMNALMINIFTGEILDFYGGIKDIRKKNINIIDKEKFREDSLRVLRGIRFASSFGFKIQKNTLILMQSMDLSCISKTRIFWELEKIFVSNYPETALYYLKKIGILEKLLHVKMTDLQLQNIALKIQDFLSFSTKDLKPYVFLYVFVNELSLNMKDVLTVLNAPKHYFKALCVVYKVLPLKQSELLEISIDLPLKFWVGICQKGLRLRAKKLKIYDEKFDGGIKSSDIIKDGFKKDEIKKEILRRKKEVIFLTCKD